MKRLEDMSDAEFLVLVQTVTSNIAVLLAMLNEGREVNEILRREAARRVRLAQQVPRSVKDAVDKIMRAAADAKD